ncbi:MAG TPA: hypothetical protein VH373_08650 [Jatrophihabitantaceae bacterium]
MLPTAQLEGRRLVSDAQAHIQQIGVGATAFPEPVVGRGRRPQNSGRVGMSSPPVRYFDGEQPGPLTLRGGVATAEPAHLATTLTPPVQAIAQGRAEDHDRRQQREGEELDAVQGQRKAHTHASWKQPSQPLDALRAMRSGPRRKRDLTIGKSDGQPRRAIHQPGAIGSGPDGGGRLVGPEHRQQ